MRVAKGLLMFYGHDPRDIDEYPLSAVKLFMHVYPAAIAMEWGPKPNG